MIQLILGLGATIIGLVVALIFQGKRKQVVETLLQNADVKKDVAVGDQEIKDLEKRVEEKKEDESREALIKFLNSDTDNK